MIKMLFIILSLFASLAVECKAQGYPSEWVEYTYSGYLYAIESDNNYKNLSETDFKNYLLDIARTNLAKQIQIRVHDVADLNKQAINGRTSIEYSSQTNFSTDVNLKLLETKTIYDTVSKKGYAIAYINRNNACNYYQNELTLIYTQITNSISIAEDFISEGFKSKAQSELEASRELLEMKNEPLFWINIFGAPQSTLIQWQDTFNSAEQCIESILADLVHGNVICISCSADVFGNSYPAFINEIKGVLSDDGCSFSENPTEADWTISIKCTAREYSTANIGDIETYFSYVDAKITIDKNITSQRIYENEISVKGGHTFGYVEAAESACNTLVQRIGNILIKTIE